MKLTRYNGHVPLFSQDMQGRERTLFGSTVQDDDINNQFTPEFLRGWGSVGSTEFPTLQDFNALAYTHNKLLSYLYQAGIPSYTQNEEYYIGSIVQYNKDIYICLRDKPTVLPTDANAWKRVQESLTFVGDGPEVMKKGAFGLGKLRSEHVTFPAETPNDERIRTLMLKENGIYRIFGNVGSSHNSAILTMHSSDADTEISALFAVDMYRNRASLAFKAGANRPIIQADVYTTINTRTDKNNVLHAGTTTPINTLNVSDMSQEVINNDLLTVTSGAVYRALGKKITGGNVVQTTGQSDVDVMSQKAYTDLTFGIGQKWRDVTLEREPGVTYTNTEVKPIGVFVSFDPLSNNEHFFIDEMSMTPNYDLSYETLSFIIPSGSTYRLGQIGAAVSMKWMELR